MRTIAWRLTLSALAAAAALAGTAASAAAATNNIFTVAGTGTSGGAGDGGPATSAQFGSPFGVAAMPDGGYLIADRDNNRVRRVDPNGIVTTVAGTGTAGSTGDGGQATAANLNQPFGVAVLPGGGFIVSERQGMVVRKVAPSGIISTVAGTGVAGVPVDGGPATSSPLNTPSGLAAMPDGGFLIADRFNNRVRRVAPDGTISTVAGAPGSPPLGDGGPATSAKLANPFDVALQPDGGFLIADNADNRVRRVAPDGTISTVAGGGSNTTADGGPATTAILSFPAAVDTTAEGGFVIAEQGNNVIRRVTPGGRITTVAGGGATYPGDGGPALSATLASPSGIASTADGGLLVADTNHARIRFVDVDYRPGPQGAQGAQGLPGAGGPQGPQGPQGTTATIERLAVAFGADRYAQKRGKTLAMRYAATGPAKVTVVARRGKKQVASGKGTAKAGRNTVKLKVKTAGSYVLTLTAVSADGQKVTDTAKVTIRR